MRGLLFEFQMRKHITGMDTEWISSTFLVENAKTYYHYRHITSMLSFHIYITVLTSGLLSELQREFKYPLFQLSETLHAYSSKSQIGVSVWRGLGRREF